MSDGLLGAYRKVLESALSSVEKLVLVAILDHWSERSPEPFPSADTLARLTSYDERTIRRTIKSLAEKGAMGVIAIAGRPNRYNLTAIFEGRLPLTESHPRHPVTPDRESPLAEDHPHPGQRVTPPLTQSPGTPDTVPPEGIQEGTQEGTHVKGARGPRTPRPKPQGTRFVPESWEPKARHRQRAQERGIDFERELRKFRTKERSRPITDIDRAFDNWLEQPYVELIDGGNRGNGSTPRRGPAPVSAHYESTDSFPGLRGVM